MSEDTTVVSGQTDELPVVTSRVQLVVLSGPEAGRRYPIDGLATIGRASNASVRLSAGDVSRNHATVRALANGTGVIVTDQGSRNGLFINGIPLKTGSELLLELGGRLQIGGQTLMVLTPHDDLEDRLRRSQRLESIGQLAGGIAHDFNNLLATLLAGIGYLETLDQTVNFEDGDVRECLQDMNAAGRMAAQLTQRLLNFARGRARGREQINLEQLVHEVVNLAKRTFDYNIDVVIDVQRDCFVTGDRAQLHQVLMNLCVNARDAMPTGGKLVIEAETQDLANTALRNHPKLTPGMYTVLKVGDSGVGMSKETLAHLFDPFFTTKEPGKGTGLGLSTAYGIVADYGGAIEVESKPNVGSCFTVILPSRAELASKTMGTKLGNRPVGTQVRLLLIDDDATFVRTIGRALGQLGYRVHWATGSRALAAFQADTEGYDIVILDSSPPRDKLASRLRAIDNNVRILLCAGSSSSEAVENALADGAVGFLHKPFTVKDLHVAISDALETAALTTEP
jgi:two-component system cell cycle sensor histidine kinase/response regulator CckA